MIHPNEPGTWRDIQVDPTNIPSKWWIVYCYITTPWSQHLKPLKIGPNCPKRKRESLPSIHFQVRSHVSFREGRLHLIWMQVWPRLPFCKFSHGFIIWSLYHWFSSRPLQKQQFVVARFCFFAKQKDIYIYIMKWWYKNDVWTSFVK